MTLAGISYQDKQVSVGIDVHKTTYSIAAVFDKEVVKKWTCAAEPGSLAEQLTRFFAGAQITCVYEAGFSGFTLQRTLTAAGIKCLVIHPSHLEVEQGNRTKTDQKDAVKLATQLDGGRLRSIRIPSKSTEARRSLSRGREQAVDRRTLVGNQIKMKLHYLGICHPEDAPMSEKYCAWAEELELMREHRFAIAELIDAWRQESKRIQRFERELKAQAEDDKARDTVYRSVPGIGLITARTLANELGDMTQFTNERQLFSYTGLTPLEHSSGETIHRGHINRQGPPRIRRLLIQAAWAAVAVDGPLKKKYERLRTTRGSKRAIVAVARRLIGQIRHCLIQAESWQTPSQGMKTAA